MKKHANNCIIILCAAAAETPTKTFKCQADGFFSMGFEECSSTYITCVDGIAYYKVSFKIY